MADTGKLTLTVVTPERSVVTDVECQEVTLPGLKGELGILPGHTPLVTLLGIGVVSWKSGGTKESVAVREGFAEVANDAVRVLADRAEPREAVDVNTAQTDKADAEKRRLEVVGEEQLDAVNADAAYAEARLKVAS